MFLQVIIQQEKFKLSIGNGYNDWVWLAHYASRTYSKSIYPQGTYLPTVLYLENIHKQIEYHPHPREKIFKYLQTYAIAPEDIRCVIRIRKANHIYQQMQRKWQREAYQKDQYLITFNFSYMASNINRNRDFMFKIKTNYVISDQVKHMFRQKDYLGEIKTVLQDKPIGPMESRFVGTLQLPRGTTSHRLLYLQRESSADQYTETQLSDKKIKREDFIIRQQPIYVPRHQILSFIEKDMKIEEDIGKSLQQKEMETKKRNASTSLCCFTFQQLWDIIDNVYGQEICLREYEKSTVERIKLLVEKNIDALYQVFFYYFVLENQHKDKKEDLGVTYQHIMHFLRAYAVFPDLQTLTDFFEFYNANQDKYTRIEDTLDVTNHQIKFPQFITILLRAIQFLQSSALIMKGETFDSAATKIFTTIVQTHQQVTQLTPFHLNLCENPKIISFIRTSSQKLKQLYIWMFKSSIESASPICIGKEDIKLLLITFSLTQNEHNVDTIIEECWRQLKLNRKDVFYYDSLVIIQWLAMALIKEEKEEDEDNFNEEEEATLIVEKIKFFIAKINLE